MSKLLHPLSLTFLLPFLFIISIAAQSNSTYPPCPSYDCNGLTISYPFYNINNQTTTQICGYEGFGINCSTIGNRTRPIITLANDSYYVSQIFHEINRTILVDTDVLPDVAGDCPRLRHGIDFNTLPLNLSSTNVDLSFHFNCSEIPSFATPIPCLDSGAKKSCFNVVNTEPESFDWRRYPCEEEVVTTVLNMGMNSPDWLRTGIGETLNIGFGVVWRRVEDCGGCEVSGGRCGRNLNTSEFLCFCSDGKITTDHCNKGNKLKFGAKIGIGVGSTLLLIVLIGIIYWKMKLSSSNYVALFKHKTKDDKIIEAFITQYGSLTTKRYKYVDIKKMTKSFKVKLGQGGFGSVFKGTLLDGRLVAVKVLNSSKASGKDFINEVASIGRTSHINIVALLGFCFEYDKRALIYEFMPNGSLEKFICCDASLKRSKHMGVKKLYEVSLGIARGLDYLHRGCNTRILHLDIKPHNILLDEDFCPKIADFGLAKLYSRKESIVSMMETRGTIGYIAPEVFSRNFGGVSHKSDVYSYGMMLLEMVGGRQKVDISVGSGESSEIYFPNWIYNRLEKEDFLLEGVTTVEENDYARKMTIVGLWCIQVDPMQRSSINEVIEMLEGSMEALKVPPKPFFSPPTELLVTTFITSGSEPGLNEIQH